MQVSNDTVDKLAHLARLEFKSEDKEKMKSDLQKILSFVDKLNELDTDGVEPLVFMSDDHNVLRKDEVISDITKEDALKNAPKADSDYFRVPKVINK